MYAIMGIGLDELSHLHLNSADWVEDYEPQMIELGIRIMGYWIEYPILGVEAVECRNAAGENMILISNEID